MKKPAYARNFDPTQSHHGESVWVFIGSWRAASGLVANGWKNTLCIPPAHDPFKFDWSVLRNRSVVVWLYSMIDPAALAVVMRSAGAGDLSFFDMASGRFVGLALTAQSEKLLAEIEAEAA